MVLKRILLRIWSGCWCTITQRSQSVKRSTKPALLPTQSAGMFIRDLSPESPISTVSVQPKISFVSCVPTQSSSPTSSSKGLQVFLSCLRLVLSAPQLFLSWLHPMLLIHFGLSRPQVALSQRIPSLSIAIELRASP